MSILLQRAREQRHVKRWAIIAFIVMGPPLVAVAALLYVRSNSERAPLVEVREAGAMVRLASPAEAVAAAARRSGMKPVLPDDSALRGYRLLSIDSVLSGEIGSATTAVKLGYQRGSADRLWIVQMPVNALRIPPSLVEVKTSISRGTIWTLGPPGDPVPGNQRGLQFLARSSSYDRIVSFEGPVYPSEREARTIIESMLRQD